MQYKGVETTYNNQNMHETQYFSFPKEELASSTKIMLKTILWIKYAITLKIILNHAHQHLSWSQIGNSYQLTTTWIIQMMKTPFLVKHKFYQEHK